MASAAGELDTTGETARRNGVVTDSARLVALHELGLLDEPPQAAFDRLTRVATAALGVPVSLVSLVDSNRQFFLSQVGLGDELAASRQTDLDHSFCRLAVTTRAPLVVQDARQDPRVRDNPSVGELGVVAYAGVPLIVEDGHALGALCAIDDRPRQWTEQQLATLQDLAGTVSEMFDLRRQIARTSLYDGLTGLPNRTLLVAHAQQQLQQPPGHGDLAVMCAGLDDFTDINQALGTQRADAVLHAAAQRLSESIRSGDTIGRLRGDMFTILAPGIADEQEALGLAGRIRAAFASAPLQTDDQRLSVSATIGVAIARDGMDAADLISEAASAMRQAKRHATRTGVAQASWGPQAAKQLKLREALRGVLDRGEITLAFQPIVDLDTGQTNAFETLCRWHHPELGDVSPAEFIPAAEANGDIVAIGEWVLRAAVDQLARWRSGQPRELTVTVNLAPLQLEQPGLAETVADVLVALDVPGSALTLEITEGVLLQGAMNQLDNLERLRELGVRIALDDFGTGYSALGYLKRFAVDTIKIDRSFIAGIEEQRYDAAVIQAILAMAKGMEIQLIAEGIETTSQRQILRLLGCRYGQGYLFSRPRPAAQIDIDAALAEMT